MSTPLSNDLESLPQALHEMANQLESLAGHGHSEAWGAVVDALYKGNRQWGDWTGKNTIECAVAEIERLYAIDKTVRLALKAATKKAAPVIDPQAASDTHE